MSWSFGACLCCATPFTLPLQITILDAMYSLWRREPLKKQIDALVQAKAACMAEGDFLYGGFSALGRALCVLTGASDLRTGESEIEMHLAFAKSVQFGDGVMIITATLNSVRRLMG